MKYGVPQGFCLGPLLFILYTSKLFAVIHHHLPTAHCFADNTELYLAFNPSSDAAQDAAITAMENCLRDNRNWMTTDRLIINDEKTEFMLIGTKAQLAKVKNITLTIGESVILPSEEPIRNLGAWFYCTFNLNHLINKICRSAYYHLHNIRRIHKYLSRESTEKLIHSFVTSHLDYCNGLLYGLPNNAIVKLQRVQNTEARVLYCVPRFSHINTPLLYKLHWLPVKYRIEYKIITLTFKAIHGTAPSYITELITFKTNSSYSLRSNNKLLLCPPSFRTLSTLGDRAFIAAAPKLWNVLPLTLRSISDFNVFKQDLKTYLFKQAFYELVPN